MKDSLYSLLELQEIDKEINTLERFKEEFPEEIGRLNGELEAARGRGRRSDEPDAQVHQIRPARIHRQ